MSQSVKINSNNKEVIAVSDESLRNMIADYHKVIVKYVDEDCKICKMLAPPFKKFSEDDKYMQIQFASIDTYASVNSIAKSSVLGKLLPFFMTYKDGLLIHNNSITSEQDIVKLLDELADL